MPTQLHKITDVKTFSLPHFSHQQGDLTIMEENSQLPITIRRVFSIQAAQGAERGRHAHYSCTQIMVCLMGCIEVRINDGANNTCIQLATANQALLVPPSLWAEQSYLHESNVLLVLCDQHYDENDYIREFSAFTTYRNS